LFLSKYSASGNDFVIFHTFIKKDYSTLAKELCHRFNGVGADGLIVLIPHNSYDFEWLFYNADGSEASMCGNGSRACAHYAYTQELASSSMKFLTGAGVIGCEVNNNWVQSELTEPKIIKNSFLEKDFEWFLVDTGVPHLVTIVDDLTLYSKERASFMRYKYNANVNFAKVEDGKIFVRTYERGVEDETQACGTGMAASFLRANILGLVDSKSKVYPTSGEELELEKVDGKLLFSGSVKEVFNTSLIRGNL
jgi:diaminopimelate epimerase